MGVLRNLKIGAVFKTIFNTKALDRRIHSYELHNQSSNNDDIRINPWKRPMSNITTGLILTTLTLNFYHLQYILPTIGMLLIFFGFRSLQRVNEWFRIAWFLTIFHMVFQAIYLAFIATPWVEQGNYYMILGFIGSIYQIVFILVFRTAMKLLFQDTGLIWKRDPLLWAIEWIVLIAFLGIVAMVASYLLLLPMVVSFILINKSIYQYSNDLQFIQSDIIKTEGKKSNCCFGLGYLLICCLLILATSAFGNHLSLESIVFTPGASSPIKANLIELGFPEHILGDMSDQNIKLLKDAIYVDTSNELLMFDPKVVNASQIKNNIVMRQVPGDTNMEATTVYVELEGNIVYVLMYFDWKDGKAYWQDGFTMTGAEGCELLDGVLLYEDNGIDYIASIPRLTCEYVTSYNVFETNQRQQISGGVSFPFGSKHQRGYVLYRVKPIDDIWIITNSFDYIHSFHPIKLPYTKTEQDIIKGVGDNKQNYSLFELKAYRDANPN